MKKIKFVAILIALEFLCLGFSINENSIILENISYRDVDHFRRISFYQNNRVEFSDEENWNSNNLWNRIFNYRLSYEDGFYKLSITNNKGYAYEFIILLSKEYMVVYDSEKLLFIGVSSFSPELISFPTNVSVLSELKEGNVVYSGSNIANLNPNAPWVEGKSDYGIGETISFEVNCRELVFFNGFVSGNKPYLYFQNSRIKTIQITFLENKFTKTYNLEDTPNPQSIIFDNMYSGKILIKILDVYKGSKYSDTCLNAILVKH